jgi:hypothetical protein
MSGKDGDYVRWLQNQDQDEVRALIFDWAVPIAAQAMPSATAEDIVTRARALTAVRLRETYQLTVK